MANPLQSARESTRTTDPPPTADADPAVVVDGLTKRYGSGSDAVTAVDEVSVSLPAGSVVGILGPNGAGKTTTIKSMLGLVEPDTGTVTIEGVDVHERPREAYARVGAVLEGARNVYWRLTVRENLAFFARLAGIQPSSLRERHEDLLERLALVDKADTPVKELSRGMKQKVCLACTLAREPRVAFLDEPTLGLDVESSLELRRELRRLADEREMTVVLSSHDMDVVEAVCDRVVVMNDGRVVADDAVHELVDVFRTQTYRVVLERPVTDRFRRDVAGEFGVAEWTDRGDQVGFETTVDDETGFYALVDRVRRAESTLVSVDAVEPDLEDVFLELVEGDR